MLATTGVTPRFSQSCSSNRDSRSACRQPAVLPALPHASPVPVFPASPGLLQADSREAPTSTAQATRSTAKSPRGADIRFQDDTDEKSGPLSPGAKSESIVRSGSASSLFSGASGLYIDQGHAGSVSSVSSGQNVGAQGIDLVLETHRRKLSECLSSWATEQQRILDNVLESIAAGQTDVPRTNSKQSVESRTLLVPGGVTFKDSLRPVGPTDSANLGPLHSINESNSVIAFCDIRKSMLSEIPRSEALDSAPLPRHANSKASFASQCTTSSACTDSAGSRRSSMSSKPNKWMNIGGRGSISQRATQKMSIYCKHMSNSTILLLRKPTNKSLSKGQSQSPLKCIVRSSWFDAVSAIVISVNACTIGWAAESAIQNKHEPEDPLGHNMERAFLAFYVVEILMRISVGGKDYWCGMDCEWNWFDVGLVLTSLYDLIVKDFMEDNIENMLGFLRVLRVARMLKLLRIVRFMRVFKELRMILSSMFGCFKCMVWACLLVFLVTYMFGVCFVQGCTSVVKEGLTPKQALRVEKYWGSVLKSMLSLFMATTSGLDWEAIYDPLKEAGPIFNAIFILYIIFFTFVLVNTLTSIFVDATIRNSEKDYHMIIDVELEKKTQFVKKLKTIFEEIDKSKKGEITFDNFLQFIKDPRMQAFTASLDVEIVNAKQFFNILSDEGRKPVDIETFVVGCMKLKGTARNIDLTGLIQSHSNAVKEQGKWLEDILSRLQHMERRMGRFTKTRSHSELSTPNHSPPGGMYSSGAWEGSRDSDGSPRTRRSSNTATSSNGSKVLLPPDIRRSGNHKHPGILTPPGSPMCRQITPPGSPRPGRPKPVIDLHPVCEASHSEEIAS